MVPDAPAITREASYKKTFSSIKDDYTSAAKDQNMFHVDYLVKNFRDFARSNLFKVQFYLNDKLQSNFESISKENQRVVEVMAKSFNIPAYDMGKLEVRRMGQRIVLPSTMNHGECQATFFNDDAYRQSKFLHTWFYTHIYDYTHNIYRKTAWLKNCEIRVYQLDNKFNAVFGISLKKAWITSIGEIQFSHDNENQITEFPASFTYSTYEILVP